MERILLKYKYFIVVVFLLLVISISNIVVAQGYTQVKGYYRKNGTYVRPHYRTNPDGIKWNNYSYPGNSNPNTGDITYHPGDDVWVNGYFRSDGTWVNGYYRHAPSSQKTKINSRSMSLNDLDSSSSVVLGSDDGLGKYNMKEKGNNRPMYIKDEKFVQNSGMINPHPMDIKALDIERAKYWKKKGYDFDPSIMTSFQMDLIVWEHDISNK
jgi:hypothetical protein